MTRLMRYVLKRRNNLFKSEAMFDRLIRLLLIILALATPLTHAQRKQSSQNNQIPLTAKQIARRVLPSVVLIETSCGRGQVMFGSGFVVDKELVATNRHVVRCGDEAYVTLVGHDIKHRMTAKYLDPVHDLAIIKVEGLGATALPLSDAQNLSVGDKVYAAGNPQGLEGTFSDGIISSLRHSAGRIQFTAAISPGSSGGPVVDEYGRVIGVTVSYLEGGQNLNFAVPTAFLKTLVASVRSGKVRDGFAARPLAPAPAPVRTRRADALGYTLIIDNSGAMEKQLASAKQFARLLIARNAEDDGASVRSFGWRGEHRIITSFVSDRQALLGSIEAVKAQRDTWTKPIIDTLYWSFAKTNLAEKPPELTNGIVILTHGIDGRSTHTWDDLLTFSRTHKVPVYCILFMPDEPDWSITEISERLAKVKDWLQRREAGRKALQALTQETGGRLFILKNEEQFPQLADEIMRALHTSRPH